LNTEFFFASRKDLIVSRLDSIRSGEFLNILTQVDDRERSSRTRCRGVNWNTFTKEDLLEIAECFGGDSLSRICEGFAKSYWGKLYKNDIMRLTYV
jgi:fanconi-associated nuclease 1